MDCAKYKLWGRKSNVLPVNQEVKAPFLCDIFIKYSSKKRKKNNNYRLCLFYACINFNPKESSSIL